MVGTVVVVVVVTGTVVVVVTGTVVVVVTGTVVVCEVDEDIDVFSMVVVNIEEVVVEKEVVLLSVLEVDKFVVLNKSQAFKVKKMSKMMINLNIFLFISFYRL